MLYFMIYLLIGCFIVQWYFSSKRKHDNFSYPPMTEIMLGLTLALIWPILVIRGLIVAFSIKDSDN